MLGSAPAAWGGTARALPLPVLLPVLVALHPGCVAAVGAFHLGTEGDMPGMAQG